MRKIVAASALAAAVVLGFGAPASIAVAAAGPAVQWANSPEDDLGRIQLSASSDVDVTGIVAHIIAPDTGSEVGTTSSFELVSGTAAAGIWRSDRVLLPELGFYQLDIEVTDADGNRVRADRAGTMAYAVKMYFADLETTPTVTYTKRTYTVSGTLMGLWPGTGATAAVAGVPVYALIPGGDFAPEVTTGAKGRFRMSGAVGYPDSGPGYVSTISDPQHRYYLQGTSDLPVAAIKPAATKVTVSLDRNAIVSGQPITVSGFASWKSPDGWVPMAGSPIAIGVCASAQDDPAGCFSGPTTSTDADGRYSYVINPHGGARVAVAVTSDDIFVQQNAYASAKITVLMRTSFQDFYAARDGDDGQVQVGGRLDLSGYAPASTVVSAQFSKNGSTGWRTIGTIDLGQSPGSSFSAAYDHPGTGYWRLDYPGVKGVLQSARTEIVYVP